MSCKYLSVLSVIIMFTSIEYHGSYVDSISWSLSSNSTIFGENIELKCKVRNDTYQNKTRQLNNNVNIIVINGKTLDRSEYNDTLGKLTRTSTLTIKSFDKSNINMPYSCQYGIKEYQDVLNMAIKSFHKNALEFKDEDVQYWIKFKDVTLPPICTASYGNMNLTEKLKIKWESANLVYAVNITLKYHHVSGKCLHDAFNLKCSVGSKTIIHSVEPDQDVCVETTIYDEKSEKDQTLGYVGLAVFTVFTVGFSLVFFAVIIHRARTEEQYKGKYKCTFIRLAKN